MMVILAKNIMNFVLSLGIYLFCVMGFYLSTNNYYFIGGKMVDFSLLGWAFMLGVWVWGIVNYLLKKDFKLVIFASQLAVICFAFDCWRLYAFAANLTMKSYIVYILVAEFVCMLLAWWRKNKFLLQSALISFLIVFAGGVIAYPSLLSWNQIFCVASIWALFGLLNLLPFMKPRYLFSALFVCAFAFGAYFYVNSFGIHFYEPKITKPAENVKVSIVVPVYNAEETLERCLDSLRKQTLKDIEIICVNDGSTDKSGEILEKYAAHDARFKIITQENKYIGAARNAGIDAATGEYVGFLDNDDWVSVDYYEDLYNQAKKYDADMAVAAQGYTVTNRVSQNLNKTSLIMFLMKHDVLDNPSSYFWNMSRFVWDKLYRRSFLEKYQVRSSLRRVFFEDFFFVLQAEMYANRIAVAHQAQHYWNRLLFSESRVSKLNFSEEPALFFVDIQKYMANADISPDDKEKWLNHIQRHRECFFLNTYYLLNEADKKKWVELCRKLFPEDNFVFSEERYKEIEKDFSSR